MLGDSRRDRLIAGIRRDPFKAPFRAGIADTRLYLRRGRLARWEVRRQLEGEFRDAR